MTGFRFLIVGTKEDDKTARKFFRDNGIKFEASNWADCSKIEPLFGKGTRLRTYWYYGDESLEQELMKQVNGSKLF